MLFFLCLIDLAILTCEQFLSRHGLPVPFREFNSLTKAIPKGFIQLIKSHLSFGMDNATQHKLLFFECEKTKTFVYDSNYNLFELSYSLTAKDFLFYYENPVNYPFEFVVNFLTLQVKFFLHKQKWPQGWPSFMSLS